MPAQAVAAIGRAPTWRRFWLGHWRLVLFCYLVLVPVLALFAYVRIWPIAWGVVLSFHKWNLISPIKPFIGWANYSQLIGDPNFLLALKNTTIYSLATVVFSAAAGAAARPASWPASAASRPSIRRSTSCR